jgi:hypothetical protein
MAKSLGIEPQSRTKPEICAMLLPSLSISYWNNWGSADSCRLGSLRLSF